MHNHTILVLIYLGILVSSLFPWIISLIFNRVEKYRPTALAEVVSHQDIIATRMKRFSLLLKCF